MASRAVGREDNNLLKILGLQSLVLYMTENLIIG
jgi:hypothetical protein